jgi:hypothetical protein
MAPLAFAVLTAVLLAAPALAVTDRRAVDGATNDVAPVVPEPSSILLFLIGVGVVGYGVHRRRAR